MMPDLSPLIRSGEITAAHLCCWIMLREFGRMGIDELAAYIDHGVLTTHSLVDDMVRHGAIRAEWDEATAIPELRYAAVTEKLIPTKPNALRTRRLREDAMRACRARG